MSGFGKRGLCLLLAAALCLSLGSSVFAADTLKPQPKMVFLGDSLIQRNDWDSFAESVGMTAVNMGVDYNKISDVSARLDKVVAERPDYIFLLVGINDYAVSWRPTVYKWYQSFLTELQTYLPNTAVFVCSYLPTHNGLRTIMNCNTIQIINNNTKPMVDNAGYVWLDGFSVLYDKYTGRIARNYTTDGVHLSDKGYKVLEKSLRSQIEQHMERDFL